MATSQSAAFVQGWLMGAGLIAAIGAQNAQVLRHGLARSHVGAVVAVCTVSDWLLIALGIFGLGGAIQSSPLLLEVFRYGGAAFLMVYGARAALRVFAKTGALAPAAMTPSLASALSTTLALTYLNPHVYLDTVVLVGGVGAQLPVAARASFALGAGLASVMWFAMLGYGAAAASRWLRRPAVWRAIDTCVAVVMFVIAAQLLLNPP